MESERSGRVAGTSWDFVLMAVTVGLMGSLGAQSLAGTVYAWWAHNSVPGWELAGQPALR